MKKELYEIPGTIANVLLKRMHEIDSKASLQKQKEQVIHILQSEEITQKPAASKAIEYIKKVTNQNHLSSIVGTYISGQTVI